MISALKNLQDKIHQLEVERTAAEDNLKSLATETNKYRDILQRESEQRRPAQTSVSKHSQGKKKKTAVLYFNINAKLHNCHVLILISIIL